MVDGINGFAFDLDDAAAELEELKQRDKKVLDNRVCACGHPVGRHRPLPFGPGMRGETHACKPNASFCKCAGPRPILKAEDLRYFLRSTKGVGHLHALGQGVVASLKADMKVEWLEDPKCDRCDEVGNIIPVSISYDGVRLEESGPATLLLCMKCSAEI